LVVDPDRIGTFKVASRQTLDNLVNGKSGISADMAIRLDKAFGGGAETWLRLQMAYDLAQARQHESRRKLREPHR
jgi:addiction module HigA family antidote